ncbi:unnamed protein product [Cyclocybe aegerita]|uniref:Uncharacterized protein n=1 Tax=Cyclocybe aegerita TaxID=1973307 RepID=A0A8S0VWU7_CYCAE|nr:unnamed protein product [Cyclocybe aegerita]
MLQDVYGVTYAIAIYEALDAAASMCDGDLLLINERAVMSYNHGNFEKAAKMFQMALDLAQVTQTSQKAWATTYLNLRTAYRKLKRYEEARMAYVKVLELDPRHSVTLGFLGIVHHLLGNLDKGPLSSTTRWVPALGCVDAHSEYEFFYRKALSIDPINPHVLELLNIALESSLLATKTIEADFKNAVKLLKNKFSCHHSGKGKEKAPDDMSIG